MANGRHEATEEAWERLRPTIERIVMKRRCTVAEAQMALIEACAQGRIRALWLGYYDPPCPLIPKMDWIGADIDLNNDRVIKANGECMAYVGFSRDDLEGWLASSDLPGIPLGSPPTESPQRKNPTDGMIRAKIREVYSEEKAAGRRVPNINQTPKLVRKKLNADGYVTSDKNIKKIADEPEFKALREPIGVRAT